jgi:Arc/MetJ-type ribon-helix-helix transcriptional regulator
MYGCVGARIHAMNSDRIRNALREALREEAEKLNCLPKEQADAALILMFEGAQIRMAERINGVSASVDGGEYYEIGRKIADRITI